MNDAGLLDTSGHPVPLVSVLLTGEVIAGRARIVVRQRYRNQEATNVEAIYTFPAPSDATLTGFSMTCRGRRLEAVVRERDEAFRQYDEALLQGHGAALLDQERPNVFAASVGNLLPGEDVDVEVEYVQRLHAEEGQLRLMIPTLVAPRYIPGSGDDTRRTAHGTAHPTNRVPDADRITPPVGDASFGLTLDLALRLDGELVVESPSHALTVAREEGATRVRLAQEGVALDRDLVLVVRNARDASLSGVHCHRADEGPGTVAIAFVPDLFDPKRRERPRRFTFVADTSGSMGGASIEQARAALRCCLRHLREGDSFDVVAFNTRWASLHGRQVPFTQATLEQADAWIVALEAEGGTELLEPLVHAVNSTADGLVVLLTDGQVGNEAEVLKAVLEARGTAGTRVLAFGIGTNVSDALLRDLARRTGGCLELIHPGERIEDKVLAQFSRAMAARVTDVTVAFEDIAVDDMALADPPDLVDGEPWTLFARYARPGRGRAVLRGRDEDGKPHVREMTVELAAKAECPALPKLWATEWIGVLERMEISGRRSNAKRDRIVKLAIEMGVASAHTSFVVVETREGERRASTQPATRVVPVSAPAGWQALHSRSLRAVMALRALSPPQETWRIGAMPSMVRASAGDSDDTGSFAVHDASAPRHVSAYREQRSDLALPSFLRTLPDDDDETTPLLQEQRADGLWPPAPGDGADEAGCVRATVLALRRLLEAGVTATHRQHGAQVGKAVEALLDLAPRLLSSERDLVEKALALAWLVAGPRQRRTLRELLAGMPGCDALDLRLRDERALRDWACAP